MSVTIDRLPARETAVLHDLVVMVDALGVPFLLKRVTIVHPLVFDKLPLSYDLSVVVAVASGELLDKNLHTQVLSYP